MKRMIAVCALMLMMMLGLVPCAALGEAIQPELLSRPLPIDFSGGYAPLSDGFEAMSYRGPTIEVSITYHETDEYIKDPRGRIMGYWVVDVRIGHASQLRTAAAESFNTKTSLPVETIAGRVNAVVAANADYFPKINEGYGVRQGQLIRNRLKAGGGRDVLFVDEDGDFHGLHLPKMDTIAEPVINGKQVINAFYFGPILVENGEPRQWMPEFTYLEPEKYYARLALCQVGPLHYKLIATTMLQDATLGIGLGDFAKLCAKEGAQIAYNLDGGLSTSIYFNGARINTQNRVNFRDIPDIVYFASAWNGEE